jgi:hypothetical protein
MGQQTLFRPLVVPTTRGTTQQHVRAAVSADVHGTIVNARLSGHQASYVPYVRLAIVMDKIADFTRELETVSAFPPLLYAPGQVLQPKRLIDLALPGKNRFR